MQKELDALDKMQKELTDQLDKQLKDEEEIIQAIQQISSSLTIYEKANTEINGTKYMVKTTLVETGETILNDKGKPVIKREIVLMASDILKAEIMRGKYLPLVARVTYNYDLTMKGNITAAVEGWIRHITDTVKPEMLES
jgi:hypothetical protein